MLSQCPVALSFDDVKSLAEAKDFERYELMYLNSFVDAQKNMRWCPNPKSCRTYLFVSDACFIDYLTSANAIFSTSTKPSLSGVECACGFRFCLACGTEVHQPASCENVSECEEMVEKAP